jgi:hypothetical protein
MIEQITQTCGQSPEQYEGTTSDGRMFYVRNRFGRTSICISSAPTTNVNHAIRGIEIFSSKHDDNFIWGQDIITRIVESAVYHWDHKADKSDCLVYA